MKTVIIRGKEIVLSRFAVNVLETSDPALINELREQFKDQADISIYPGRYAAKASLEMVQNKTYVILVDSHGGDLVPKNSVIGDWYSV